MPKSLKQKWEPDEVLFLREHYEEMPIDKLSQRLKNRTDDAIHGKAHRLGITGNRYGLTPVRNTGPKIPIKGRKRKSKHRRWCDQRFASRKSPIEGKRPVRIDHKTIVYVPAGATEIEVEVITRKYKK